MTKTQREIQARLADLRAKHTEAQGIVAQAVAQVQRIEGALVICQEILNALAPKPKESAPS